MEMTGEKSPVFLFWVLTKCSYKMYNVATKRGGEVNDTNKRSENY